MISADQAIAAGKRFQASQSQGGFNPPKIQNASKAQPIPSFIQKAASSTPGKFAMELPKAVSSNPIFKTQPARMAGAGLAKLGNALSLPANVFGGFLQGTRREAEKRKRQGMMGVAPSLWAGVKNIPMGVRNKVTPGSYLTDDVLKIKNDPVKKASIGLATDLIADPLNYINPASVIAKVGKVAKVPQSASKIAQKAPVVQKGVDKVGDAFVYGYKQPEKFMKMVDNVTVRGPQKAAQVAEDIARPLITTIDGKKLSTSEQKIIGDIFEVLSGQSDRALTPNELKLVTQYKPLFEKTASKFEKLAKTQTKLGIPEAVFEKYLGKYTGKRSYISKMGEGAAKSEYAQPKKFRLNLGQYKKREDIPREVREAMGQIKEPAYGAATAGFNEASNIEKLKFYKSVAKKYAGRAGEGMERMPINQSLGVLSGAYLPKRMAAYVNQVANPEKTAPLIKFFKEGKTILSPKQLLRNVPASQVQAMMNPSGRADSFRRIPEAIKELRSKGKYYQEAKKAGVVGRTFAATELAQYLPEGVAQKSAKFLGSSKLGRAYEAIKKPGAALQNANEEMAKMQVFINERKAGRTIAEAAKMAEETGFDYSKVTPWIDKLRKGRTTIPIPRTGVNLPFSLPFATYGVKAAELTGKTLAKKPTRIANVLKTERAVEKLSEKDRPDERYLPDYQKDAMRLPKKDKKGNPYYLNTKYLYPWGSLQDVGASWLPLGQSPDPLYGEFASQGFNYDIFTKKQIQTKPGSKGREQRIRHAAETFLPTPLRTFLKIKDSATKAPRYSTTPSVGEAIAQELGLPLLKYDERLGRTFKSYEVKNKIKKMNTEMTKELQDYQGNPKKQKEIRDFYMKEIRKVVNSQ